LWISVTIVDLSGRTLSGQTVEAFWRSVEHAAPVVAGVNCSLGAEQIRPHAEELSRLAHTYTSCHPNAGLPDAFGGYDEQPADTSRLLRGFAEAGLVILNGAGYDDWGKKLLDANPASARHVLTVADLLGKKVGDNPHFWYSPAYVVKVADRITAQYKSIDSADASYFDQLRTKFAMALQPYTDEIATIKHKYAGTPVGATESIFVYLAAALGLNLTTPAEFMNAVAEGNDPPASAVVDFQAQISANQIKVLVYNVQTTAAVTTTVKGLAASHNIPSVGVSETLLPENLTFQDWQLRQLTSLEAALSKS